MSRRLGRGILAKRVATREVFVLSLGGVRAEAEIWSDVSGLRSRTLGSALRADPDDGAEAGVWSSLILPRDSDSARSICRPVSRWSCSMLIQDSPSSLWLLSSSIPCPFCSPNAPVSTARTNQSKMKPRFASNAATLMPISSSSLRMVRHNALSLAERLSAVWSEATEASLFPWRNSSMNLSSLLSTLIWEVLMKAVNMVMFEVRRARISAMSSLPHFIRSHVCLLLVPRLSYLLTRVCKSARTVSHPSLITLSLSALAGGKACVKSVSSLSFSTACKDKISVLMLPKLPGAALPAHCLVGWRPTKGSDLQYL